MVEIGRKSDLLSSEQSLCSVCVCGSSPAYMLLSLVDTSSIVKSVPSHHQSGFINLVDMMGDCTSCCTTVYTEKRRTHAVPGTMKRWGTVSCDRITTRSCFCDCPIFRSQNLAPEKRRMSTTPDAACPAEKQLLQSFSNRSAVVSRAPLNSIRVDEVEEMCHDSWKMELERSSPLGRASPSRPGPFNTGLHSTGSRTGTHWAMFL